MQFDGVMDGDDRVVVVILIVPSPSPHYAPLCVLLCSSTGSWVETTGLWWWVRPIALKSWTTQCFGAWSKGEEGSQKAEEESKDR